MGVATLEPPPAAATPDAPPPEPAPEPPAPVVVVEHLARRFDQHQVLRDVSFSVLPGRAFGLAGANGAGKTVLLRLLAGLDRPSAGRASVHGEDSARRASRVRRRVGYVPEEPNLYEGLSAQQYLTFVGRARGLGPQVRAASVETLLQVVGLEALRQRDVSAFSPGERRRLMLAAALLHEPDVLLLDDPLRALDGQARLEQLEVLRELRQLGATQVLTATRPEDLLEVCDDFAVLRDGVIAWSGDLGAAQRLGSSVGQAADEVRVRAEVLDGLQASVALLRQRRDVRDLEVEEVDGRTELWFLFSGDREALGALLPQLVRAGTTLAYFGVERRSAANALAALFRTS